MSQEKPGPQLALPKKMGRAKLTAILKDPDGVYERDIVIDYTDPRTLETAHDRILALALAVLPFQAGPGMPIMFQPVGFWRTVSELEHELIPMDRIKSVNISISPVILEL